VLIEDVPLSSSDAILRGLNELLEERFQICHTTIQFEHVNCAISANGCAIPVRPHSEEQHHRH
jgi:cobalt-zinc-cadmium efflux system protein